MAIISKVESRTLKGRLMLVGITIALIVIGATTIYPFLVMVSGSLRSAMDAASLNLVPRFLTDNGVLYRKFLETKYNLDVPSLNRDHHRLGQAFNFAQADLPADMGPGSQQRVKDFRRFVKEHGLSRHWQELGAIAGRQTTPGNLRKLRNHLHDQFHGDLRALGKKMGAAVVGWGAIVLRPPEWLSQQYDYQNNPLYKTYFRMQARAPLSQRQVLSVSGDFLETMIFPDYGRTTVAAYNKAHARSLSSYTQFVLPPTAPGKDQPQLRKEWVQYVHEQLNPSFVVLEGVKPRAFRQLLRQQYPSIDELNQTWSTRFASFSDIPLPDGRHWLRGARREDYSAFLAKQPPSHYRLIAAEYAWRDWLRRRYGSIAKLNHAHHTHYAAFSRAAMPVAQLEYAYVVANAGALRWKYSVRNFINVLDALLVRGRAFVNTIIFCSLAILMALLINPLAAYAMSRFNLPGTYKFLLILMATMAFPPMVMLIPQFILLRKLGLLNTFIALLLPLAANGYLIFLLKGFFDSLPSELYEAARIDGASELRMFFQITLSLSKPILAVVALRAFNAAYVMFLYALVVCPDPHMWLISVWLYQFQETANSGAVYASVLVASIPTLLVFIFTQRTIMRGIVIPVEK